jgi:GDP-4-dehydro-6-deoxy-D-mannose reductase
MPPTILVTGAAGFAGSHLVDALAADGARLVGWRHRDAHSRHPSRVQVWRTVDVLDPHQVNEAVAEDRPDVVYHLAGDAQAGAGWDHVGATLAVNLRGTHHVLRAVARFVPNARVLVTGSALVYKTQDAPLDEDSPIAPAGAYGVSKLAQETVALRAAAHDGLRVVVTRSFNHIGPRQSPNFIAASVARQIALIEAGRSEPALRVGNLSAERDLMDVRDTVRAYAALVERGTAGRVYNVCLGEPIRMKDLVERLVARARVPIEIVIDPSRFRPVDVPRVVGNNGRLRRDTRWTPSIPIDRGLDDLLEYWRHEIGA